MENKKLFFVLIVLIPVCIGLFFYGKGLYKTDHSFHNAVDYSKENENDEKVNLDDTEIKDLINFLFKDKTNRYIISGSDFDNYFYLKNKLNVKNISMNDRLAIVAYTFDSSKISLKEMTDSYNKIFGESIELKPESFSGICNDYSYNDDEQVFVSESNNCSVYDTKSKSMSLLYDVKKNNKSIEVYEYFVKLDKEDDSYRYYSDLDMKTEILSSEEYIDIENLVNLYSDKLGVYKYKFTLENDKYVFTSVEKVK